MEDNKRFPITSDPNYTNDVFRHRQERQKTLFLNALRSGNTEEVVDIFLGAVDADIEKVSCEDALYRTAGIYENQQKTFVANIITQVIERHIIDGLEDIFSPVVVNAMSNKEVEDIASELLPVIRDQRVFLNNRIKILEDGREIFKTMIGDAAK
ncbi:hypothetical protein GGS24DRAFT_137958 [Hypoxylon argillaceum]|nr:hypothetical protein GGS24DRAFT_137958 [Hypoxylon argillaceum]